MQRQRVKSSIHRQRPPSPRGGSAGLGTSRSRRLGLLTIISVLGMLAGVPVAHAQDNDLPPEIIFNSPPATDTHSLVSALAVPEDQQLKNVQIDPALRALVQQLEDPSFEVREQATRKLVEMAPDKMQLYAMLAPSSDLSPEQRYRLLAALREYLLNSPRGAVGISMEPVMQMMGGPIEIRVTDLLPGLPAERVLKIDDRITHVDDQPLFANDDLQFRVQCKRPGDKVTLTIKRPRPDANAADAGRDANRPVHFDTLRVELELGSAELLREFNERRPLPLNQALPVSPTRVESMRIAQARQAEQYLAPRPRTVVVTGHSTLLAGSGAPQQAAPDPDVENHPTVREILRQRKRMQSNAVTFEEAQQIRDQWDKQLIDLYRQTQSRALTTEQREYLFAVIERCMELMRE